MASSFLYVRWWTIQKVEALHHCLMFSLPSWNVHAQKEESASHPTSLFLVKRECPKCYGAKHSPLGSKRDFWGITENTYFEVFCQSFEGIVIRKSKICHTGCLSSVLKLWVSDVTPYFHEPKVSYLE